jgi:plastocyanin
MEEDFNARRGARLAIAGVAVAALVVALAMSALASASAQGPAGHRQLLAATATVGIRGFAYRPGALTVGRGTKVVFANHDSVAHTATRGGSFSTGRIRPGRSVAVRFTQRGVYRYHCTIHPTMRGKVVVR